MIKRLIFDIDGTLITGVSFKTAIEKTLLEYGIFSEENIQKFIKNIPIYESLHRCYEKNKYFCEYYGEKICKPEPQVYLDAIGNNKPYECVMVGDNLELDTEGAKKCGINTIWINNKNFNQTMIETISVTDVTKITENLIHSFEK